MLITTREISTKILKVYWNIVDEILSGNVSYSRISIDPGPLEHVLIVFENLDKFFYQIIPINIFYSFRDESPTNFYSLGPDDYFTYEKVPAWKS